MVAITVHLKTVWGIFKIFFVCHKKILPCPFASCNLCCFWFFYVSFFLYLFIIYTKVHPGLFTKMSPKRFLGSLKNELEIFWFPELGLGVRLKKVEHTKDATWSVFLLQELVAWAEIPLLSSTDWTMFFFNSPPVKMSAFSGHSNLGFRGLADWPWIRAQSSHSSSPPSILSRP